MTDLPKARLRVGFVGTGFIAAFHLRAMIGVRNVEVTGVFSRQAANRERICKMVDDLGLGRQGLADGRRHANMVHPALDIRRPIERPR